jgi:thiamine biosynthesis lipoprotein
MADALSTSCFILGSKKGIELLESLGIEGFCVTSDKKVYVTRDLKENLEILDKSFSL